MGKTKLILEQEVYGMIRDADVFKLLHTWNAFRNTFRLIPEVYYWKKCTEFFTFQCISSFIRIFDAHSEIFYQLFSSGMFSPL